MGRVQFQRGKYVEAAGTLRDALALYEKARPDLWERYDCESLLGATLAAQKRFSEAEPLLLSGYDGMMQRQATIPASSRTSVEQAGQGIVNFYQDWGKPDKAAEWRSKLGH